jgi:hypothetical protein
MKCSSCQTDNKDDVKSCRKCGAAFQIDPVWKPTWQWHLKVLGTIYAILIVAYFGISAFLKKLPPPYGMRDIPKEITPWMK